LRQRHRAYGVDVHAGRPALRQRGRPGQGEREADERAQRERARAQVPPLKCNESSKQVTSPTIERGRPTQGTTQPGGRRIPIT
jgi:hypothetical protein